VSIPTTFLGGPVEASRRFPGPTILVVFLDAALERTEFGCSVEPFPRPGSLGGPFRTHSRSGRPMRIVWRALVNVRGVAAALCTAPGG